MKSMEEIAAALSAVRLEVAAAETGLSYFTLLRYRDGRVTHPPHASVVRLSEWIEKGEAMSCERCGA